MSSVNAGAITSRKVKNGSLLGSESKAGSAARRPGRAPGSRRLTNVLVSYSGPECPNSFTKRTTRVTTYDVSAAGFAARSFVIWLED